MKNENYITIQGWMVNELKLKGNELIVYALIHGFSQDGNSKYDGSLQYVANAINVTKNSAFNLINGLVGKNIVQKIERGNSFSYRTKILDGSYKKSDEIVQKSCTNNNNNNIDNNMASKNFEAEHTELTYEPFGEGKETYKTKRKIFLQKGLNYNNPEQTEKQKKNIKQLESIDYFKFKALDKGVNYFKDYKSNPDSDRNKKIRGGFKRIAGKGYDMNELIDWWFDGKGAWCKYKPDQMISDSVLEDFDNREATPEREPLLELEGRKFYSREEIEKAHKDKKIRWSYQGNCWMLNK